MSDLVLLPEVRKEAMRVIKNSMIGFMHHPDQEISGVSFDRSVGSQLAILPPEIPIPLAHPYMARAMAIGLWPRVKEVNTEK